MGNSKPKALIRSKNTLHDYGRKGGLSRAEESECSPKRRRREQRSNSSDLSVVWQLHLTRGHGSDWDCS